MARQAQCCGSGQATSQARETETFAELCHDLGIGVRAAYYLVVIAEAVDDDRFAEQDVEDVGWTKARVLIEADLPKKRTARCCRLRPHALGARDCRTG